MIPNSMSQS